MDKGKSQENREYTRISMKVEVEVERHSDREKRYGQTECVSMNGCFIDCIDPFPMGTECKTTLYIGGRDSDLKVCVKGKITFVNKDGMALEIVSHLFMESYDHLHRLVLYNASEDADRVEEEIETHLHNINDV
ncbi:PilZ domain-containing protein [Nitrospira defluvii]|nr:PilZ domain-containing protein [Nitrospira defluvii]